MRRSFKALAVGFGLLLGAIAFDVIGADYQILPVLIVSFMLAVGGAVVAVRGMFEFLGERS